MLGQDPLHFETPLIVSMNLICPWKLAIFFMLVETVLILGISVKLPGLGLRWAVHSHSKMPQVRSNGRICSGSWKRPLWCIVRQVRQLMKGSLTFGTARLRPTQSHVSTSPGIVHTTAHGHRSNCLEFAVAIKQWNSQL
jgi:hypothetical protein